MLKTCNCGSEFEVTGGWKNVNKILWCKDCGEARASYLEMIENERPAQFETLVISMRLRDFLTINDFPGIDVSYRKIDEPFIFE